MSSSQSFLRNKQLLEKPLNWCIFATAKNTLQVIKKWQYFIKDVCQETVYILLEEILFCCLSTTTMTNMVWNILQESDLIAKKIYSKIRVISWCWIELPKQIVVCNNKTLVLCKLCNVRCHEKVDQLPVFII
jgi:hypothetical protein